MKDISFVLLLVFFVQTSALLSQQREGGQFFDVPVISHPLSSIPVQLNDDLFNGLQPMVNPCDDRDRRIRKMMIDIECDRISLDELGFDCDSLEVGIDAKFIVMVQSTKKWGNGEYLTLVRPASDKTAQNWLRGDEAQRTSPYFPIGTTIVYMRGDTLEMK